MKTVFDYKTELNDLSFSDAEKDAMTKRLLAAQQNAPNKKHRGLRRSIVAAVGAAACLTVMAGATGILKLPSAAFAPVFGTGETEIIDQIGYPLDASATSGGVTITADAVLGDKYHYAVTYTIATDDGSAFGVEDLKNLLFEESGSELLTNGGVSGCAYFYDADPADNAIQYVELYETTDEIPQDITLRANFKNLRRMDVLDGNGEPSMVAQGRWSFPFRLNYEDLSTTMTLDTPVTFDGIPVTLDTFTISPIGLQLTYTFSDEIPYPESPSGKTSRTGEDWVDLVFGSAVIELHLKDGTTRTIRDTGGSSATDQSGAMHCTKGETFDQIIPLEDMKSVTICGVTFPIEAD